MPRLSGPASSRRSLRVAIILAATGVAATASRAHAELITLSDQNAVATFDTSTDAGQNGFTVDGVQELSRQWFWYRVGDTGPDHSLDTLTQTGITQVGENLLNVRYAGDGFKVAVQYDLTGGVGASAATLAETIKISNTSADPLPFHFFEYDHFTLDDATTGNTAAITGGNTADQSGPAGSTAEVTVLAGTPAHYQAATGGAILASLTDGGPTTLGDFAGPVSGDAEFAFEWDPTIAGNGSYLISKLKTVTPPAAVPLPPAAYTGAATLGGLALLAARKRLVRA